MNYIINQDGESIIADGQDGSPARTRGQYNRTYAKVFDRIESNWCRGGLDRHTQYDELVQVCKDDGLVFLTTISKVIQSAYFYFDIKQKSLTNL